MELFTYAFGLSLAPTLVGFLLGLGAVRLFYKIKLVKQAKWIAYLAALLLSTLVITLSFPIADSTNVVVGTTMGFVVTLLLGRRLRKKIADDIA